MRARVPRHHTGRDATPELLSGARVLVLFTIGETPWAPEQRLIVEETDDERGARHRWRARRYRRRL